MSERFSNIYEDSSRADAYSQLEFPGTYFLAYRDLPAIINAHVSGGSALDFGCGTGRSTRFLNGLGFNTVGVDISEQMIRKARETDPEGEYFTVGEDNLQQLHGRQFDLVLCTFTFDNIPAEKKASRFQALNGMLKRSGFIVNLVSSPQIYVHEWASFSTIDFPENKDATDGETVHIIMLDVDDRRPVEDILCSHRAYSELYDQANLTAIETHRPTGRASDNINWVNETTVAPWTIYVLRPNNAE
jgi:ubiquinone/menaquinone biosynthesis C-methylase UbiE